MVHKVHELALILHHEIVDDRPFVHLSYNESHSHENDFRNLWYDLQQ